MYLPTDLPINLSVCLSIYLSVCLSVYLFFIYLPVCTRVCAFSTCMWHVSVLIKGYVSARLAHGRGGFDLHRSALPTCEDLAGKFCPYLSDMKLERASRQQRALIG